MRVHFEETRTAIDGATLRRVERYGCVAFAIGAVDGDFDFLFDTGGFGGGDWRDALVFGLLATFTAFGRILQSFIVIKSLFACCPNKILSAVNTQNTYIFKFRSRATLRNSKGSWKFTALTLTATKSCELPRPPCRMRLPRYCLTSETKQAKSRTFISAGAKAIRQNICSDTFCLVKLILRR